LTDRLPRQLQWVCEKVVDLSMIGICLFVMVWGSKLSMEMMRQGLAELPWLPVGYTYLPLPIGSFLTLLFVLERAWAGPQTHRAVVTFDHEPAEVTVEAI
ncbi:MAG: TRAP transporter small permease subunit, partial [Betaproteobacteria bacterium]